MMEGVEEYDEQLNKKLMLRTFDYVDFGGDVMDDGLYDSFENSDFDDIEDESDVDSGDFDELDEAIEYAGDLNIPSLEKALDRVGSNGVLYSWVENKMKELGEEEMKEYEKITGEIDMLQGYLREGLKRMLSLLTNNVVYVSDSTVAFCKELFERFAIVAIETAFHVSSLRENKIVTCSDMVEAMKMLGRNVYYDNEKEEDDEIQTIFDFNAIKSLVDLVRKDVEVENDVYHILQHSFEDFLHTIISNSFLLKRTYNEHDSVSVEDMMMVLHMWSQSPCNNGSGYLIQKLFI